MTPAPVVEPLPRLRFERHQGGVAEPMLNPAWLGGHALGATPQALSLPLLSPSGAVFDVWASNRPASTLLQHGAVRYRSDGHWLYGQVQIDDRLQGLQAATHQAYAEIFEVLEHAACPHLLRLWNYFSGVNQQTQGLERYRQFNMGRQQAFFEAQRSAFDGAPAACALGTREGPLNVCFLAGRQAPRTIENPRQVSAYRYPETYGPCTPTFSRAALVDVGGERSALFISGTASIVGHASMHLGDVRLQTEECLTNLRAVRAAATEQAGVLLAANELAYTVYVRYASDLPVVRQVFEQAVGPDSPAAREAVYLLADICRADLLVEIEAHGFPSNQAVV